MVSLIRPRAADRGVLASKPFSPQPTLSAGYRQASGSASRSRDGKKPQSEATVVKPWADQPWPLIEVPSRSQQITHPALHIANEIAHIHNAMLRGLNAIYLQAPHVQQAQDIADLSFLTQSWSTWLLDHHELKESMMLPGFENVLGVPAGTLALPHSRSPSALSVHSDRDITRENGGDKDKDEEPIAFLLHRVYAYASATHKDPEAYDATTLQDLLDTLANSLVPHLTGQVGLLASMREMCFASRTASSDGKSRRKNDIPAPLPMPMVAITRTASSNRLSSSGSPAASPPVSPSSSTFSSTSASTTSASSSSHSPPTPTLSLFPSTSTARPHHHRRPTNESKKRDDASNPGAKNMEVIDTEAKERLARARALLAADDRATKLTQVYLAADARASAKMDRYIVPPMMVRLRDVTFATSLHTPTATPLSTPTPTPVLSRRASSSSLSSRMSGMSMGMGMNVLGGGGGLGGNAGSEWPRMSIPAVHAIADKLSPRHEGAWRFLPCDVWGRPRELPFLE